MLRLSSIIIAILLSVNALAAKSPHGTKFSIKCDVCHNPEGWTIKVNSNTFDHTQTSFPLVGQHKIVDCRKCHIDLMFSNAKTTCISCHTDMHQQTVGQECQRCHTPNSWIVSNITEIHRQSRFPLNGQHAQVDCYLCHKSASLLRFDPMGAECADCHSNTYTATTNPSHVASKFPKDCFLCHTEKGWQPAKFDHNTHTTFPLKGGHVGVDCNSCHSKGFAGTSTECSSCHLTTYNATTNPAHATAKFSTDCKTCHTETAWKPATFNHNTGTTFPLTGGHIGVDCISCHSKGYTGTSTICVSCHLTNYNASTNPAHATAKFSTDCKTCHNAIAWKPSTFNHSTSTTFPLTGGHIGVDCLNCHSKGYAGTSTLCVSCHQNDYNATTNPGHVAAKFSTDCKTCHSSTAWKPSTFNHNTSTTFPISGAHIGVSCISCHSKGYAGISTDCFSCHAAKYNATTNPAHAAAKFPTTCLTCHTQNAWTPSTYNHDAQFFPINSGKHNGKWTLCSECHTNPTNYAVFNCLLCHEHSNKASVDSDHKGQSGYVYNSINCFSCHPKGNS